MTDPLDPDSGTSPPPGQAPNSPDKSPPAPPGQAPNSPDKSRTPPDAGPAPAPPTGSPPGNSDALPSVPDSGTDPSEYPTTPTAGGGSSSDAFPGYDNSPNSPSKGGDSRLIPVGPDGSKPGSAPDPNSDVVPGSDGEPIDTGEDWYVLPEKGGTPADKPDPETVRIRRLTVAADGSSIPIVYGRVQVKGKVFAAGFNEINQHWTIGVLWCLGEIEEVEVVYANSVQTPAISYTGTSTQTYSQSLAQVIPGYQDDLVATERGDRIGIAYSVISLSDADLTMNFTAIIKGLKVADYRDAVVGDSTNIINNGDFQSGAQGWGVQSPWEVTPYDPNIVTNRVLFSATASGTSEAYCFNQTYLTSTIYDYSITVLNYTSGSFTAVFAGVSVGSFSGNGTYTGTITSSSLAGSSNVRIVGNDFIGEIDGIILRESGVTGGETVTLPPKAYSTNPSLCLADFINSEIYGEGLETEVAGVVACANANDELLTTSSGDTVPRRSFGFVIERPAFTSTHRENIRKYAGCFITRRQRKIRMIPDRPTLVIAGVFNADNIVANSLDLKRRSRRDSPTAVKIQYTKTTDENSNELETWPSAYAGVKTGEAEIKQAAWREDRISMPGIQEYQQAFRDAVEILNRSILVDLFISFVTFDEAIALEIGDVIQVSHPIGLTDRLFRVTSAVPGSPGRYNIKGEIYDPLVYSDTVQDEDYNDTTLPGPSNIPQVTGLTIVEEIWDDAGTCKTRIRADWDPITYPYGFSYVMSVYQNGVLVETVPGIPEGTETAYTASTEEGSYYSIKVVVTAASGGSGNPAQSEILSQGINIPPQTVQNLTGYEVGGEVFLYWDAVCELPGTTYEVRRSISSATSWEYADVAATGLSFSGLSPRYRETAAVEADFTYHLKAISDSGVESLSSTTTPVQVTFDSYNTPLGEFSPDVSASSLTLMRSFRLGRVDHTDYVVPEDPSDTIAAMFPNAMDTYTDPLCTYRTDGAAEFLSDSHFMGATVSGTWTATIDATILAGTYTAQLEISTTGTAPGDWTAYPSLTYTGQARYLRVRVSIPAADETVLSFPSTAITLGFQGISLSGTGTSAANGPTQVLPGSFQEYYTLSIVPDTAGNEGIPDSLVVGVASFDVHIFDSNNTRVSDGFSWSLTALPEDI